MVMLKTCHVLHFLMADIDECTTNTSTCEQLCSNTIGSFLCDCLDGFRLNATDNSTCDGNSKHCSMLRK